MHTYQTKTLPLSLNPRPSNDFFFNDYIRVGEMAHWSRAPTALPGPWLSSTPTWQFTTIWNSSLRASDTPFLASERGVHVVHRHNIQTEHHKIKGAHWNVIQPLKRMKSLAVIKSMG